MSRFAQFSTESGARVLRDSEVGEEIPFAVSAGGDEDLRDVAEHIVTLGTRAPYRRYPLGWHEPVGEVEEIVLA